MPIISVTNQKGGVGKSTCLASLAKMLTDDGYKVLCIDLDPQRNLDMTAGMGLAIPPIDLKTPSMLHVMRGECSIEDAIIHTPLGDLARASSLMTSWAGRQLITQAEYEANIRTDIDGNPVVNNEAISSIIANRYNEIRNVPETNVLRERIYKISKSYDFVLIDTNPSLMLLTINALYAADYVLVPTFTDDFSRSAINELWDTIQNINYYDNTREKDLKILGILITKSNKRTFVARAYTEAFEKQARAMNTVLFKSQIRQSVLANEAAAQGKSVFELSKGKDIGADYLQFKEEFLTRINELEGRK